MSILHRRRPEKPEKPKETHTHTTSREQWQKQWDEIQKNIESLTAEYAKYRGVNAMNSNAVKIIRKNLTTRTMQLAKMVTEMPEKDRLQDIKNNKWIKNTLAKNLEDVGVIG